MAAEASLEAGGEAGAGSGFLRSGFGWLVIVLGVVVIAAVVAGTLGDGSDGDASRASVESPDGAPEGPAGTLVSEAPGDETSSPESGDPVLVEKRVERATQAISSVSGWIGSYANEYGRYPTGLGVELAVLSEFAGDPASVAGVLNLFEDRRIAYSRSLSPRGDQERYEIRGVVVGTGGREVSIGRSRSRLE
jgi:hypothetical protein